MIENCNIDTDVGYQFILYNLKWQPIEWAILEYDGNIIARGSSKYDNLGNLTEDFYLHTYNASPSFLKYENKYDDNGKLIIKHEYDLLKDFDEPFTTEEYEYDEEGIIIEQKIYYFSSPNSKYSKVYDEYNNLIREEILDAHTLNNETFIYIYSK